MALVACTPEVEEVSAEPEIIEVDPDFSYMKPEVIELKNICELAVMDCYYHNVVKFEETVETGVWIFSSTDITRFWFEYDAIVTIGLDADLIKVAVDGSSVEITLPKAQVLDSQIDAQTFTSDSLYIDKDSEDITSEDFDKAFADARSSLESEVAADAGLMQDAQDQAELLLRQYINNIGNLTGVDYQIEWSYVDAEGNPIVV